MANTDTIQLLLPFLSNFVFSFALSFHSQPPGRLSIPLKCHFLPHVRTCLRAPPASLGKELLCVSLPSAPITQPIICQVSIKQVWEATPQHPWGEGLPKSVCHIRIYCSFLMPNTLATISSTSIRTLSFTCPGSFLSCFSLIPRVWIIKHA